jgi:hypothetical protein
MERAFEPRNKTAEREQTSWGRLTVRGFWFAVSGFWFLVPIVMMCDLC